LKYKIEIVKKGTLNALLHELKFKTVKIQKERESGNILYTIFGDYIYTFEPRWWYKPFMRFFRQPDALIYDS